MSPLNFPNMFINILYLEIYHVTNFDVLIQSGFKVIQKITLPKFMQDISCRHNHSIFQLPLWMEKLEKKNYKTVKYLENEKNF